MTSPQNVPIEIHPGIQLKGSLSTATDVVLTGKFEGDLKTLGCLTVTAGGAATGTIEAGALLLEPGNLVEAKVKVGTSAPQKSFMTTKMAGGNTAWSARLKKFKELAFGRN
jgi:hypothetical protein